MLVYAAVRTKIRRPPPKIIQTLQPLQPRNFKHFNPADFARDIESAPWSVCSVFDNPDDCYWAWQKMFNDICNEHAP